MRRMFAIEITGIVIINILWVVISCFIIANDVRAQTYTGQFLLRINQPNKADIADFLIKKYDIAAYYPGQYLDIVATPFEYSQLVSRGLQVMPLLREKQLTARLSKSQRDSQLKYRDYSGLLIELQQLAETYPSICKLYSLGDSWGRSYALSGLSNYDDYLQHQLWVMKVSDNVNEDEDEPGFYFIGGHHARELISVEVVMNILIHLLKNYTTDSDVKKYIDRSQIWILPLLNPDGHKIVRDQTDVWWRKNIRDNNLNGYFDIAGHGGGGQDGVDLNRNYGFQWGDVGASDDPESFNFHGINAWSEPEVVAMKNFMEQNSVVAGISYHSYAELVLYPYGYQNQVRAPDEIALKNLAVKMAQTIPSQIDGYYRPYASWELYPAMGDHCDYAYGEHGIFSYTIELATSFIPPVTEIQAISENNIAAAKILLERPFYSTVTGTVLDSSTGNPVQAEIIIHEIDHAMMGVDDRIQSEYAFREAYKSDRNYGRYYRILPVGTYTISFWADGYATLKKENVKITQEAQTQLDALLTPSAGPQILIEQSDISHGMVYGTAWIPLLGENITGWIIDYGDQSVPLNKHKEFYKLEGLIEGEESLMITAIGIDEQGRETSQIAHFQIQPDSPACPRIDSQNTYGVVQANGDEIRLYLSATNVDHWAVTSKGIILTLPGLTKNYLWKNIPDNFDSIQVQGIGYEESGIECHDEVTLKLIDENTTDISNNFDSDTDDNSGCFISML